MFEQPLQGAVKPTMKKWLEQTRHVRPIVTKRSAVEVLRALRAKRDLRWRRLVEQGTP